VRCLDTVSSPLDLLLPAQCPICDSLVQRQTQLCAECFREIDFICEPICERCGVPLAACARQGDLVLCPSCAIAPPLYRRARAALRYNASSRRLILPFKHGDRSEFAFVLAARMAHVGAALLCGADALVPVPLHRRRLFWRRYNQAGCWQRVFRALPAFQRFWMCWCGAGAPRHWITSRQPSGSWLYATRSSCVRAAWRLS
jgi:predicted amidophosphoribosyltransferase